jgi:ethanolamine utilization protein EutQ (cupin superfamily)
VYEDLRLLPYHSDMSNAVYDHKFARATSSLDAQGFATWMKYDARDRVLESSAEVENQGRTVIGRNLYNDQKK